MEKRIGSYPLMRVEPRSFVTVRERADGLGPLPQGQSLTGVPVTFS